VPRLWRLPYSAALLSQRQCCARLAAEACLGGQVALPSSRCGSGSSTRRCAAPSLSAGRMPSACPSRRAECACQLAQAEGKTVNHQLAKEMLAGLVCTCCCRRLCCSTFARSSSSGQNTYARQSVLTLMLCCVQVGGEVDKLCETKCAHLAFVSSSSVCQQRAC